MIDLKNLGGGKQLIQEIIQKSKPINQPWSKAKQLDKVKKIKNTHSRQSRLTSKY